MNIELKGLKNLSKLKNYKFDDRYVCNNAGKVYLIKKVKNGIAECEPMKPFKTKDGYIEYVLTTKATTKKHIQAQRIVASLFLKTPTDKSKNEVNHKDGNRSNNRHANLQWMTHQENIEHSFKVLGKKVWNSPSLKSK